MNKWIQLLAETEAARPPPRLPVKTDKRGVRASARGLLAVLAVPRPGASADFGPERLSMQGEPVDFSDRWCWPQSDAMNGAEMTLFAERARQFTRRGMSADSAEEMADRLVIRDREQDERRACWECAAYRLGRCGNHRGAGLHSRDIGPMLAAVLQRCPGFQPSR